MAVQRKSPAKPASLAAVLKGVPHIRVKVGRTDVIALGAAHVSRQSVEDVAALHAAFRPDAVAVELCQPRLDSLTDPDRWKRLDIARVIKERKIWLLASSLILSAFQKKIGAASGVSPGDEMLAAVRLARESGAELILADREVRVTLSRAWSQVGFFSRLWLMSTLMASLLINEEVGEEEIERLKQRDVFEDLLNELPPRYRSIRRVIIDERDLYLAESLRLAAESKKPKRLLAVLGAGHLPGVERTLQSGERQDLFALSALPVRKKWKDLGSWVLFGVFFLVLSAYLFTGDAASTWQNMQKALLWWVGARVGGATLGALIARARPLTALATALVAPFTFFLGFTGLRLWMVSALVELRARQPSVEDFENIASDTETTAGFFRSLYRNRVLHLFFIIFAVSLGLTLGNVAFWWIVIKNALGVL